MAGTSAGNKKGYETKLKKYGKAKLLSYQVKGGQAKTRGYFGKLKDDGRGDELIELSKKAIETKKHRVEKIYSEEIW